MDDFGNELPATSLQQINQRFGEGGEPAHIAEVFSLAVTL